MWILGALILIVCALGIYSVRAWLLLLQEERESKTCPRCGSVTAPDAFLTAVGPVHSCIHCEMKGCPLKMSARGWIQSTLRPPE